MHLVLGGKELALISQQREASMMPTTKRQRVFDAFYSIGQSTVSAMLELGKSVNLPRYGNNFPRNMRLSFLKSKHETVEFSGATECPPNYEARRK